MPRDAVVDGFRVGDWVQRRRRSHLTGELRPEWAAMLESLPGWRWRLDRQPFHWADGLTVLQAWVTEHGHALVPVATLYRGYPLGVWVQTVRCRHTRAILTPHQTTVLQGLPGWAWGERDARFQHGLALLHQHQHTTGFAIPNQFYFHLSGFTLGAWVGRVRTLHRTVDLPADRVTALEAVPGWQWNPQADHWASTLTLLHATAHEHGGITHCVC